MIRVLLVMAIVVGSNACDNALLEGSQMYCEKSVIIEDDEVGPCCDFTYKSVGFGDFEGSEINNSSKGSYGIKVFR